jgi:aryl-alcohol dehydrogenase-like predicted oxidoreductase
MFASISGDRERAISINCPTTSSNRVGAFQKEAKGTNGVKSECFDTLRVEREPIDPTNVLRSLDLTPVATHYNPVQLALAWLLQKSPVMLPIPGTANIAHLEENMTAAKQE